MPSGVRPIEILLVEDSPTDADLTRRALAGGRYHNHLSHAKDGFEALKFLRQQDEYADARRPDLILLDLNMPRVDGREVLKEIRADDDLKTIPVIVLTTSAAQEDVLDSYELATNAYVVKPVDLDQFFQVVKEISHFWFQVVTLPPTTA